MEQSKEIERRIYSSWAFSENEHEKGEINYEIYEELKSKFKVYRDDCSYDVDDCVLNDESWDVIIGRKAGYNHAEYKVHRNRPGLKDDELALLCDDGSLCFGYQTEESGKRFYVFED